MKPCARSRQRAHTHWLQDREVSCLRPLALPSQPGEMELPLDPVIKGLCLLVLLSLLAATVLSSCRPTDRSHVHSLMKQTVIVGRHPTRGSLEHSSKEDREVTSPRAVYGPIHTLAGETRYQKQLIMYVLNDTKERCQIYEDI